MKLVLSPRSDPVERDVHSVTGHIQRDGQGRMNSGGAIAGGGGHGTAAVFRVLKRGHCPGDINVIEHRRDDRDVPTR